MPKDAQAADGRNQDFARAQKAAERGNAGAQAALGWMCATGHGAPQDDAKAAQWFQKAAAQGHAGAQAALGWMSATGRGVPQDDAEAAQWFQKAAAQGHAGAQNRLGAMYFGGYGVPKDESKAAGWFQKAAAQGYAKAQYRLGLMYLLGRGVIRDRRTGCDLLRASARQGTEKAIELHKKYCAAEKADTPGKKVMVSKSDPGKRPLQAAPPPKADSSQADLESRAELEKRLKDDIKRLITSSELLGAVR